MPRFKWNDPKAGRLITTYINTICKQYPVIAKDIVKHGIGDLGSWFTDMQEFGCPINAKKVKCGCLVGTTALVAMKRRPALYREVLATQKEDFDDGPFVLFNFIRVSQGKPAIKEAYLVRSLPDKESRLYECIEAAGMAAYDESGYDDSGRQKEVIDHMEGQIRKRLGIKK